MRPHSSSGDRNRKNKRKKKLGLKATNALRGIWKCKKEDLSSFRRCKNNIQCPCGEWCRTKDNKCVRATCNVACDGKKSHNILLK